MSAAPASDCTDSTESGDVNQNQDTDTRLQTENQKTAASNMTSQVLNGATPAEPLTSRGIGLLCFTSDVLL